MCVKIRVSKEGWENKKRRQHLGGEKTVGIEQACAFQVAVATITFTAKMRVAINRVP